MIWRREKAIGGGCQWSMGNSQWWGGIGNWLLGIGGMDPGVGAVRPDFFFPDGDFGFQGVDEEAGGFEGFVAVGGGDGDQDGRLFDLDAAGAVEEGEAEDGPALA